MDINNYEEILSLFSDWFVDDDFRERFKTLSRTPKGMKKLCSMFFHFEKRLLVGRWIKLVGEDLNMLVGSPQRQFIFLKKHNLEDEEAVLVGKGCVSHSLGSNALLTANVGDLVFFYKKRCCIFFMENGVFFADGN
jgi:hypothetical protein